MIFLGADHNGFALKQRLRDELNRRGFDVADLGARRLELDDDYPDFAVAVARAVAKTRELGILICGSGHGMAIAANKVKGVRAVTCATPASARASRRDDHANVLSLPAWEITWPKAKTVVDTWLRTQPSSAARHRRRVAKIQRLER